MLDRTAACVLVLASFAMGCGATSGALVGNAEVVRCEAPARARSLRGVVRLADTRLLRHAPKRRIAGQLRGFFSAVGYRRDLQAAGHLSREYLGEQAQPQFASTLQAVVRAGVERARARARQLDQGLEALPEATVLELFASSLDESERGVLRLALMMEQGEIDRDQGLRLFVSAFVADLIGRVDEYTVHEIELEGTDRARVLVHTLSHGGARRWLFDMHLEWGDWRISNIQRIG